MLDVSCLDVRYGDFHVIHQATFTVGKGKIVGLVGPNGHGKSTLLKAVCGLIPIANGSIRFKGADITSEPARTRVARGLVYIAEDRRLFPDMTVRENLNLGAYLVKSKANRERNRDLVFTLYPRLFERQSQLVRTLSGGEAQMVALGRGMMSGADCMAIDEPSLGLSPKLVETMMHTLTQLNSSGISLLLVEQNISLVSDIVDVLYNIEEGSVRPTVTNTANRRECARLAGAVS
jgi:branched-chain amino acid transport system ATP-binding protein